MKKISLKPNNDYCPQTLFLYGTYSEDGRADFGLFCWFSYTWDTQLGVMACIGGNKRTLDNIRRGKIFSANLVTEKLLPLADYMGCKDGNDPEKMKGLNLEIEKGQVLDVPVLAESPVAFELEVKQFLTMDDGTVMLCAIRNVLQDETLAAEDRTSTEKLAEIAPVQTTCSRYFSWQGKNLGAWGEPMAEYRKES